jgi:hypothetical protein
MFGMFSRKSTLKNKALTANELMLVNMQRLIDKGFKLEQHFFQVTEKGEVRTHPFWRAIHSQQSDLVVMLFFPSKDIQKDYTDSPETYEMAYFHDTGTVAAQFKGAALCLMPVAEFGAVAPSVSAASLQKPLSARMHWVTLMCYQNDFKFFDPKGSPFSGVGINTKMLLGYDNSQFKDFMKKFGNVSPEEYKNKAKEPHVQGLLDTTHCGYYCTHRHTAAVDQLLGRVVSPLQVLPAYPELDALEKETLAVLEKAQTNVLLCQYVGDNYVRKSVAAQKFSGTLLEETNERKISVMLLPQADYEAAVTKELAENEARAADIGGLSSCHFGRDCMDDDKAVVNSDVGHAAGPASP